MMNISQQQAHLFALGYYKLKRKDGSPAIDGLPGPATKQAIYNFQLQHKHRSEFEDLVVDGVWGPNTEKALREVIGNNESPQEPDKPANPEPSNPGVYKWIDISDFKCRCKGQYCNGWPAQVHKKTLDLLEMIGEHYQKPIVPHSGLRCKVWNAMSGGAATSKHMYGMAMDFHIEGVSHQELYDFCDKLLGNSGGLGIYSWGVHIDDRPVKGRWDSR